MLTCIPHSFCSWDYRVFGGSFEEAFLAFDFFTEQGAISLGGSELKVRKHGWLSGHWTLERDGIACAEARKPNPLFRSFDVQFDAALLTVQAQSAFTRCYDILHDGSVVGTMWPAHAFTRRAFIECTPAVPELAQLFSFWLAVLTWRRAANNNSGAT